MSVTAKLTVTLEIQVSDSWGDNCTVAQVKRQAIESAEGVLRNAIEKDSRIKVIGKTEAVSIQYTS